MADETKALNKSGEDAAPEATPATEEQATDEVVETQEPVEQPAEAGEETSETDTSTLKQPKKGVQARIGKLTKKVRQVEAEKQSLADKLAELTAPVEQAYQAPQMQPVVERPILEPGEEIDTNELELRLQAREQRMMQRTQAAINFNSQVNKVYDNINKEAKEAIDAYPELDPKSELFNKELSDSVTAATEAQVKVNPSGSVRKFVDKLMKPYNKAVTKEVGEQRENIAKQVSQQAMRPTSLPKGEKKAEDMTTKELEEKLGVVY